MSTLRFIIMIYLYIHIAIGILNTFIIAFKMSDIKEHQWMDIYVEDMTNNFMTLFHVFILSFVPVIGFILLHMFIISLRNYRYLGNGKKFVIGPYMGNETRFRYKNTNNPVRVGDFVRIYSPGVELENKKPIIGIIEKYNDENGIIGLITPIFDLKDNTKPITIIINDITILELIKRYDEVEKYFDTDEMNNLIADTFEKEDGSMVRLNLI